MRPSLALQVHREAIRDIVARHNAGNPRVFGSAGRGDDREDSDLDLLVDPLPGMTLFDLGGIMAELEDLLGIKADVVTPRGLSAAVQESKARDLRPL